MAKFTQGPWHWKKMRTQQALQDSSGSCFAGVVMPHPTNRLYHVNKEHLQANAAIIAAAPELYEALIFADKRLRELGEGHAIITDAIAKAEGVSNG